MDLLADFLESHGLEEDMRDFLTCFAPNFDCSGYFDKDGEYHGKPAEELKAEMLAIMPDPDITISDRIKYGYTWHVMLPVRFGAAKDIFEGKWPSGLLVGDGLGKHGAHTGGEIDIEVFLLHRSDAETVAESVAELEIHAHGGGIFGVEYDALCRAIERSKSKKAEAVGLDKALLEDMEGGKLCQMNQEPQSLQVQTSITTVPSR
jgi:hypothetical protein